VLTEGLSNVSQTVAATTFVGTPDIRAKVVTKASNNSETLQPTQTRLAAKITVESLL
jgi:hypothetical protein